MRVSRKIKVITIIGLFAGVLILSGCGKQGPAGGFPPGGTPEVTFMTIQPRQVVVTTELTGRTSANLIAEVRPQVSGIIQKRLFTEGSDVRAGQVLYQIDPAPFQATYDNAAAALGRAEANLPAIRSRADRFRELLTIKAVSQQDYDDAAAAQKQAEADVAYCKATLKSAQINLDYTKITAPISGRIGKSSMTAGALVTAHQPTALASIQQLDPMYVDVPQSTTELLRLRRRLAEGDFNHDSKARNKVHLLLEDGTRYPLDGTLQFRDISVDQTTGSVILRIVFPNSKGVLLPGMFVRASVEEGSESESPPRSPTGRFTRSKGAILWL